MYHVISVNDCLLTNEYTGRARRLVFISYAIVCIKASIMNIVQYKCAEYRQKISPLLYHISIHAF